MIHLPKPILAAAVISLFFLGAGCSTVSTRVKERPEAYQKLPAPDQALVQQGKIRSGFDMDTVYLAWGKADHITREATGGKPSETWIYMGYRQETIQYFDVIPHAVGRGRFVPDTIYRPIYVSHPYVRAQATFQNGKVVAWNEGQLP